MIINVSALQLVCEKHLHDYLDDVSTTYVDETILALNRGQKAANMAYRGDELKTGSHFISSPVAQQRGNPTSRDWYYFVGINFQDTLVTERKGT